jgi:hypothetical protein
MLDKELVQKALDIEIKRSQNKLKFMAKLLNIEEKDANITGKLTT